MKTNCPCWIIRPPASSNCSTKLTVAGPPLICSWPAIDGKLAGWIGDAPQCRLQRRCSVVFLEDRKRGPAVWRLGKIEAQRGPIAEEVVANIVHRLQFANDGDIVAQLVRLQQREPARREVWIALADSKTLLPDRLKAELAIVCPVSRARHGAQFLSVIRPALLRDDGETGSPG